VPIPHTTRFRRGKLPHWEVDGGRYFVTVRLADSLPAEAVHRLQEIHHQLSAIESASVPFADLQRQYFRTMEKYLDNGAGASLLKQRDCAQAVLNELSTLTEWQVDVPHHTIMPNHWHALIVPRSDCERSLPEIMKRLKGRTAKQVRSLAGGSGPVWQREWFDRWIRDAAEWERTVTYIHENPVKAGLAPRWQDHPWTR
jgi:putative transposase